MPAASGPFNWIEATDDPPGVGAPFNFTGVGQAVPEMGPTLHTRREATLAPSEGPTLRTVRGVLEAPTAGPVLRSVRNPLPTATAGPTLRRLKHAYRPIGPTFSHCKLYYALSGVTINVTAGDATADQMPRGFVLRRAYEGAQVIIQWDAPLDTDCAAHSIRLVRRRFGFPENRNDGTVLFDGPPLPTQISDVAVEACVCYFYKLFVVTTTGDVLVSKVTEGSVIPVDTGFFGPKLWEIIPELYKLSDKGIDEATSPKRALTEGAAAGSVEVYNLEEDGSVLRGPLQRMFRLFGPILDEAKGLIDCFPAQLDVDTSCPRELEGVAKLLGLALNKELSPEKFRNEVRVQADTLKFKGTAPGILGRLRSVSGLNATITEQCETVLYANDVSRTSAAFTAAESAALHTSDDSLSRSVGFYGGEGPFWLWFNVFMEINTETFVLTEELARKWCIAIEESSPTCHKGFLHVTTESEDEIPFTFVDAFDDAISTDDDDPMAFGMAEAYDDAIVSNAAKWLITNDITKLTNTADATAVTATPTLP